MGLAFKGMSCTPVLVLHGHCGCRSQLAHSFPDLLYTVDSHDDHVCMLQHTEQNSGAEGSGFCRTGLDADLYLYAVTHAQTVVFNMALASKVSLFAAIRISALS